MMNMTISFEEGPDSNGWSNGSRARRKPKPHLLFGQDPARPFKIRSYTCVKCSKKVEVRPGGYLQTIDSNFLSPVHQFLCTDCHQVKNAPPASKNGSSSVAGLNPLPTERAVVEIKVENGGSSESDSERSPNNVTLAHSSEINQNVSIKTEGQDTVGGLIEGEANNASGRDEGKSNKAAENILLEEESVGDVKPNLDVQLPCQAPNEKPSGEEEMVFEAKSAELSKVIPSPNASDLQLQVFPPGRINLTEEACEQIKHERKQREMKLTSPPFGQHSPGIVSKVEEAPPHQEIPQTGPTDKFDILRKQIESNWPRLSGTEFNRITPSTSTASYESGNLENGPKIKFRVKVYHSPQEKSRLKAAEAQKRVGNLSRANVPPPKTVEVKPESVYWFKCPSCPEKYFTTPKDLDDHLNDCHQGPDLFPCPHCEKTFSLFSSFVSHKSAVHLDIIEYLCKYCADGFSNQEDYCSHLPVHKMPIFKCSMCEKTFIAQTKLDSHMNEDHGPKTTGMGLKDIIMTPLFQCPICEVTYEIENSLAEHMRDVHPFLHSASGSNSNMNPFGQSDGSIANMEEGEILVQNKKPRTKFRVRSNILKRMKAKAGGFVPNTWIPKIPVASDEFSCSVCKVNCPSASYLQKHVRTHLDTKEGNFKCPVCNILFSNQTVLERHCTTLHPEYRPHICRSCSKSFKLKSQLKSHERTHSSEKPFACLTCGKKFLTQSYVNCHVRYAHLGIKNYIKSKQRKMQGSSSTSNQHLNPNTSKKTSSEDRVSTTATMFENPDQEAGPSMPPPKPKRKYTKRSKPDEESREMSEAGAETTSENTSEMDANDIRRSGRVRKASSRYT